MILATLSFLNELLFFFQENHNLYYLRAAFVKTTAKQ